MNLGGGGYIRSESGQDSFEYEEDTRSVVQTNGSHCTGLVDQSPQGDGTVGNRTIGGYRTARLLCHVCHLPA